MTSKKDSQWVLMGYVIPFETADEMDLEELGTIVTYLMWSDLWVRRKSDGRVAVGYPMIRQEKMTEYEFKKMIHRKLNEIGLKVELNDIDWIIEADWHS